MNQHRYYGVRFGSLAITDTVNYCVSVVSVLTTRGVFNAYFLVIT